MRKSIPSGDLIASLEARLERTSRGCWEWMGARSKGYGIVRWRARTLRVHRLMYEHYVGPIPDGMEIDHRCRNKACSDPSHLEAVTHLENVRRAMTHRGACSQGHTRTPENTVIRRVRGLPVAVCRECRRVDHRNYMARRRMRQKAA